MTVGPPTRVLMTVGPPTRVLQWQTLPNPCVTVANTTKPVYYSVWEHQPVYCSVWDHQPVCYSGYSGVTVGYSGYSGVTVGYSGNGDRHGPGRCTRVPTSVRTIPAPPITRVHYHWHDGSHGVTGSFTGPLATVSLSRMSVFRKSMTNGCLQKPVSAYKRIIDTC